MVNRDTTLEAECKYMPHSKKGFGKVVKQASVAEQHGMRGCKKQKNHSSESWSHVQMKEVGRLKTYCWLNK